MPEIWPATFPKYFEIGSDSEGLGDGRISSTPETGPPLMRRRSSAMVRPIGGTMPFTKSQLAELKTFISATLIGGSLPFEFPAQSETGTWLVMFPKDGLPTWSRIGQNKYRVQLQLSVMP